jgi:aromatic ring-opening dioxygenase LigB subunit
VVVTPHSVHVEGHFAVVTAGRWGSGRPTRELAAALLEAPLPILGVSYGGNDPATAEFPLDWGTEVPLEFVRAPRSSSSRPRATGRSRSTSGSARRSRRCRAGRADRERRHGHAHDPTGPTASTRPRRVRRALQEILASDRLDFLPLAELVEPAKADSLWQLLVLQGACGRRTADVLAYAAPTYYGMLVAEVQTAA